MTMRQNRKHTNAAMQHWINGARNRFRLSMCRAMIVGIGQSCAQLARKYKSTRYVSVRESFTLDQLEKLRQESNSQGGSFFLFSDPNNFKSYPYQRVALIDESTELVNVSLMPMPRSNTFLPERSNHE